ncbi:hypothetical protein GGX14DRAFT_580575 [Mycena pura]|uniref:Uncharacterized protein n=1 Tax=Mycena pura TaxID=153505 RepID=A0AAD6UMD3_9AGAR|nr:hypothetical protein GGX14DRAFT_580575 [Mycena pura]
MPAPPSSLESRPALEAGTGSAVQLDFDDLALAQLEADAAGASTSAASDTRTAFIPWPARILVLLLDCILITHQLFISEVVSLEASSAANASAALLFLIRGLEVLFVAMVLFVAWWKGAPSPPPPPVEVVFDDETARDEVSLTIESKPQQGGEKSLDYGQTDEEMEPCICFFMAYNS